MTIPRLARVALRFTCCVALLAACKEREARPLQSPLISPVGVYDRDASIDRLLRVLNAAGPADVAPQDFRVHVLGEAPPPLPPTSGTFMICGTGPIHYVDLAEVAARAGDVFESLGLGPHTSHVEDTAAELTLAGTGLRTRFEGRVSLATKGTQEQHVFRSGAPSLAELHQMTFQGRRPIGVLEPENLYVYLVSLAEFLDRAFEAIELPFEPLGDDSFASAECPEPTLVDTLDTSTYAAHYRFPEGTTYREHRTSSEVREPVTSSRARSRGIVRIQVGDPYTGSHCHAVRLEQEASPPISVEARGSCVLAPPRFDPTRPFTLVCSVYEGSIANWQSITIQGLELLAAPN